MCIRDSIIRAFKEKTQCPTLINTSFNVRGEPIVCTPLDAWRCFMLTDIDALVVEDLVLKKENQYVGRPESNTHKEKKIPSQHELKWFGILLMPFFIALYFLFDIKFDSPRLGYSSLGVGATISLCYLALPKYRSFIYRLWIGLFYPIGWIISHLVMSLLYYLVFTPVGLLMRATGHDPLTRSFDSAMKSYWFERDAICELDKKRSLKQF